jgi:hypothetical protein
MASKMSRLENTKYGARPRFGATPIACDTRLAAAQVGHARGANKIGFSTARNWEVVCSTVWLSLGENKISYVPGPKTITTAGRVEDVVEVSDSSDIVMELVMSVVAGGCEFDHAVVVLVPETRIEATVLVATSEEMREEVESTSIEDVLEADSNTSQSASCGPHCDRAPRDRQTLMLAS